jgi:hypothetical protein
VSAVCGACGRVMGTTPGCAHTHAENDERRRLPRRRYGTEFRDWTPDQYDERCHDCGALVGEFHHPGCDVEVCPFCGGQMCPCWFGGSEPASPDVRERGHHAGAPTPA